MIPFSVLRAPEAEGAGPQVQEADPSVETPHLGKNKKPGITRYGLDFYLIATHASPS